eukprot:scaffold174751_cov49-Attheya_sp.AAC.1
MSPWSLVQIMFADKLNEDIREPVYTFESPFGGDEYGILLPSASFWIQMSAVRKITKSRD